MSEGATVSGTSRRPVRPYGGVGARERVAARRARIIGAGTALFGTSGYLATGVKDICRAAGLTDRYFYESFRGTRELFLTVFDTIIGDLFAAVAEQVAAAPAGREQQLRAGIATFLRALDADRRTLRIVFAEPACAGPEAEAHMRASLRRFAGLVADTARATRSGNRSPIPIELFAHAVVGMLERVLVEKQDDQLDLPIEELIEHCTTLAHAMLDRVDAGAAG
ncbi:TetR/AcrR family transcriptional regulator [Sciscionella marina]|uniref:TetR/AcrR family transcriptional regulator n=1 Tax=Sciscionella marina TaxID=508770 RepID=UPI000375E741|nr:TetR/AcrR family transcriptional regulator [Sciscionella marina]